MSDKKHALALVSNPKFALCTNLDALQKACLEQLTLIRRLESEGAMRAIFTGLALHRIKASLKHGEFGPWLEANVNQLGRRQVNYYMRLALECLARTRATVVELVALPDGCVAMNATDIGSRRFAERVEKFVGECSLADLLVKYGIKGVVRDGDAGTEGDTGAVGTDADGQMFFAEIAEHVLGIRKSVLNAENIARLSPRQLDDLRAELANLNSEFSKLYDQARGKRKDAAS
jgi:hypothetical protein